VQGPEGAARWATAGQCREPLCLSSTPLLAACVEFKANLISCLNFRSCRLPPAYPTRCARSANHGAPVSTLWNRSQARNTYAQVTTFGGRTVSALLPHIDAITLKHCSRATGVIFKPALPESSSEGPAASEVKVESCIVLA